MVKIVSLRAECNQEVSQKFKMKIIIYEIRV